jgi:rhamnosyltransferase
MTTIAVIVTYQPDIADLEESLAKLRSQVSGVVLVDNASRNNLREVVSSLAAKFNCALLENGSNLGIAEALNQGVRFAMSKQADFVLFFDQDSFVSSDFVALELACYRQHSAKDKIGLVTPSIVNRTTGHRHLPLGSSDGHFLMAQTSGALMPLAVFEDAGFFNSDLFIDYVDYEHCLRMARKSWKIAYAADAELHHAPGNAEKVRFFGREFGILGASPLRTYYRIRNCLWLTTRYLRSFPVPVVRLAINEIYVFLRALVFEPKRFLRMRSGLLGLSDVAHNRMGSRSLQ